MSGILIFCNKGDFISENLKKNFPSQVTVFTMEELMAGARIIHRLFEDGTHTTVIRKLDGEEIIPGSFDLIFNRIKHFSQLRFLNGKDSAYASMEWLALISSIYYSLREKVINFNIQLLLNTYNYNRLLFLDQCRKNGLKIEPLYISSSKDEIPFPYSANNIQKVLFLKNCLFSNTTSEQREKMISIMNRLNVDFAEIFFKKDRILFYNPFPLHCSKNEIDFIGQTFLSIIDKSYAVNSRS